MKKSVPRWVIVCMAAVLTCSLVVGSLMLAAYHIRKNAPLQTNVFLPQPQSIVYYYEAGGGEQTFTAEEAMRIYDAFCVLMTEYTECGGCDCGDWHTHQFSRDRGIQFRYEREIQYTGTLPHSSPVDWSSMHFDAVNLIDDTGAMFVGMSTDGKEHYLQSRQGAELGAHLNFEGKAADEFWAVVESCLD